ncbi:MAG: Holliday junction resolvase RuvX [Planctomycetes bacterium]|jgi:putative Holliday junction resolvase|nr:Holliday junction resolvase RuvX [Planctomycetota bacterium]
MNPSAGGRVLGVDFGLRRVGLAVSDPTGTIVSPAGVLEVSSDAEAVEAVRRAAEEKEAREIVVGVPYNMDGSLGDMGARASAFAGRLAETAGLPVHRWDERLTTLQAERALRGSGMSRRKRDSKKDAMSAHFILQSFLDARSARGAPDAGEEGSRP